MNASERNVCLCLYGIKYGDEQGPLKEWESGRGREGKVVIQEKVKIQARHVAIDIVRFCRNAEDVKTWNKVMQGKCLFARWVDVRCDDCEVGLVAGEDKCWIDKENLSGVMNKAFVFGVKKEDSKDGQDHHWGVVDFNNVNSDKKCKPVRSIKVNCPTYMSVFYNSKIKEELGVLEIKKGE